MRAAEIKTAHGMTNRSISKLYPLEICAQTVEPVSTAISATIADPTVDGSNTTSKRPRRAAAIQADRLISDYFCGPEDNSDEDSIWKLSPRLDYCSDDSIWCFYRRGAGLLTD